MGKEINTIPDIIISRLPVYYQHLKNLQNSAKEYISSEELASLTGFSSSLIRKDLSYFGTFGRKSYGYDVYCLFQQISIIMGFNYKKKVIIIGAGHLGQALAYNKGYTERGYQLISIFDKNPKLIGLVINDIEIQSINNLESFLENNKVEVAALTVPGAAAQKSQRPDHIHAIFVPVGQGPTVLSSVGTAPHESFSSYPANCGLKRNLRQ